MMVEKTIAELERTVFRSCFFCRRCFDEKAQTHFMVGYTLTGFQVWCHTHDCQIIHIDFEGHEHPEKTSPENTVEARMKGLYDLRGATNADHQT